VRLFPTSTKTRRAALFRRAIVEPRSVRHARGDMRTLLAFAGRPPTPSASWRARFGSRPSSARRVPTTPRRPPVVGDPRPPGNGITMAHDDTDATADSFRCAASAAACIRGHGRGLEGNPASRSLPYSHTPAMEFSLRCAPPSRPSAFPLARSNQAHRSAASAVAGRAATGQRAECALITGQGSPDRVRTGAWPHDPIHV
jgi:hypothetical protein